MAGRPPKPTSLKLVQGNAGKRALNKQEPDPDYLRDLTPPEWLPDGAKVVWRELAPMAARAKLLTVVDIEAFAHGCVALAKHRKACAEVEKTGSELDGKALSPWEMVRSMTFKQSLAVFDRFGMNPVARTRINVQPQALLFGSDNGNDEATPAAQADANYFK